VADEPDLDLLSPLIARARALLVGKPKSYVTDAIDFARALIAAAEAIENLRAETARQERELVAVRLQNDRLVGQYADALVTRGGARLPGQD
jgi:hypothetical protein